MTPAGLAYLTMPFSGSPDDADALLAQGVAQDAEHLAAAARFGAAHPAFLDAHLGEAGGSGFVGGPHATAWQRRSTVAWSNPSIAFIAALPRASRVSTSWDSSGVMSRAMWRSKDRPD